MVILCATAYLSAELFYASFGRTFAAEGYWAIAARLLLLPKHLLLPKWLYCSRASRTLSSQERWRTDNYVPPRGLH